MHPQLFFPTSSVVFGILILIHLPTSSAADNPDLLNCSQSYSCANIPEIGFPFWGGNRPQYCGHPIFGLNCSGEAATITIQTRPYRVLSIDRANFILTVARAEFWNNDCPQYLYNATLDTTHFSYGSDSVDLMLYYNCRSLIAGSSIPFQFSCAANGSSGTFGIYSTQTTIPFNVTCGTRVLVRVNQIESQALLSSSAANLTQVLDSGFGLNWQANNTQCSQCVGSGGTCGYNTNTVSFLCYCKDEPYSSFCGDNQSGGSGTTPSTITPGDILTLVTLGAVPVLICCFVRRTSLLEKATFWKKQRSNIDHNVELVIRHYGSLAPKRYRYADISKMTNSFKDKLGQGGYGAVYKGKLSDGRLVAVKVLSETKGNGEEFINEVASISTTSHVNVVSLLGFCFERNKRALVYEFMAKGSLDKFIWVNEDESSSTTNCHLELRTLYEIAIGTARGLEYLHRGCSTQIVHFDIKPHNILLDEDFCPKISDFGLAKLGKRKESKMSMVGTRGTAGYIAPEVFSRTFGQVSHKSDVYSYGMLVLEVTGARDKVGVAKTSEIYFPHWIYEHLQQGKDLRLRGVNTIEEEEIARKMILVGLWCIQTLPKDRPPMSKVVEMLEGSLQSLQIPPMPFLSSPARPILSASDSYDSSSAINNMMEVS